LNLMLAQRLVSRVCPNCKKSEKAPANLQLEIKKELENLPEKIKSELKFQEPFEIFHGQGCPACQNKGLLGRVALFEVFQMTAQLTEIIGTNFTENDLVKEARRQGMISLRQDGILKALAGLVTMEEVFRETGEI